MLDTHLVAIILAVGGLLPLLTAAVQQPKWDTRTRTWMAVGVSLLAGLVTYVSQFGLNWQNPSALVTTIVGVIIAASTSYKTIWKPAGVAPAVEALTSGVESPAEVIASFSAPTAVEDEGESTEDSEGPVGDIYSDGELELQEEHDPVVISEPNADIATVDASGNIIAADNPRGSV